LPTKEESIPNEKYAELQRLSAQVRHAEEHGQTDTVHHVMLARLQKELGLIPTREIEGPKEEPDGKQDL
jgi:hypothetical protein